MGLNRKTMKHLNMVSGGSFMHVSAKKGRSIISDFMLEFGDELFDKYGNTSNYHVMRKP
jgi:hypothetical protein